MNAFGMEHSRQPGVTVDLSAGGADGLRVYLKIRKGVLPDFRQALSRNVRQK
jgi:hypothetical protein